MNRVARGFALLLIAATAFGLAFAAKTRLQTQPALARTPPPPNAPDSVQLAAMGIRSGRHLVAYLLVGSRCGFCQKPETKAALASVHNLIQDNRSRGFRSVTVVAVALDGDLNQGLKYINSIGIQHFDEISVGNRWLNENLVRLIWRERAAKAAVPQVVLVSRNFRATANPLSVVYGPDSLVGVLSGRKALIDWVHDGATINGISKLSGGQKESDTTPAAILSRIP